MSEVYKVEGDELTVEIKGQKVTFRGPTSKEIKACVAAMEGEGVDPIEVYNDFFVKLGLNRELLEGMSQRAVVNLFEYAVGAKKN